MPFQYAASNVFLNIIGGLLTVVVTSAYVWARNRLKHRRFRSVFGKKVSHYNLVYGSLVVAPIILKFAPPEQQERFRRFSFGKLSLPENLYSAENVGSGCEIRGAAYVAAALGRLSNISSEVVPDETVKNKLDLDFVSFGATTNLKTLDVFKNEANPFCAFDYRKRTFVNKQTGDTLYDPPPGSDYGIIMKINPSQFPERTWICCAGYGESGASGCAWFLSRKWNHVERYLATFNKWNRIGRYLNIRDTPFMAVVVVDKDRDESAILYELKGQ